MLTMRYKCRRDSNEQGWLMLFDVIDPKGNYVLDPYMFPVSGKDEGIKELKNILNGKTRYYDPQKYSFTRLFDIETENIREINWIGGERSAEN